MISGVLCSNRSSLLTTGSCSSLLTTGSSSHPISSICVSSSPLQVVCQGRPQGSRFFNNNTNKWSLYYQSLTTGSGGGRMTLLLSSTTSSSISTSTNKRSVVCKAQKKSVTVIPSSSTSKLQFLLWAAEGIYIFWLFLLPYAPGDPVWAISSDTINSLVGLSLNFFFILPLMNSVGIRLIDAPVLHPMSEGLFNFVIGWTFMFAPLLFTDCKRNRYKGSLDILWGLQMFLTNTFLIPYMAIRLNEVEAEYVPRRPSQLGFVMTNGAPIVGLIGGAVCLVSALWALFARMDGNFGTLMERWEFLIRYLGSERLAYAFIWDICLYIIFQPWLIGDNIQNVQDGKVGIVSKLRFLPVIGLVAYLLSLNPEKEL